MERHITNKICHKPEKTCPNCGKVFCSKQRCQSHITKNICGSHKSKLILRSQIAQTYVGLSKEELIIKLTENEHKLSESEHKLSENQRKLIEISKRKPTKCQ